MRKCTYSALCYGKRFTEFYTAPRSIEFYPCVSKPQPSPPYINSYFIKDFQKVQASCYKVNKY